MKPENIPIPSNVLEINLSIDVVRTSKKAIAFPLAYPLTVKRGQKLVITTKGIYFEEDHEPER